MKCGSDPESPVIVFVSKMLSVPQSDLPKNRKKLVILIFKVILKLSLFLLKTIVLCLFSF